MSDIRTLKTLAEEPLDGNVMTGFFSVTAGMPMPDIRRYRGRGNGQGTTRFCCLSYRGRPSGGGS